MDPILKKFEENAKQIKFNKLLMPYLSNLSGEWITTKEVSDYKYWSKHLRACVKFSKGVNKLLAEENSIFLELGPGKTLSSFVKQHINKNASISKNTDQNNEPKVINLIRHPMEMAADDYYLLNKIGQLWLCGQDIDWREFYSGEKRYRIPLPTYPFEGQKFWIEEDISKLAADFSFQQGLSSNKKDLEQQDGAEKQEANQSISFHPRTGISTDYAPPRNNREHILTRIWQNFFGIQKIGIYDDFFDLGGDSLKAYTLISRIHKEVNVRIPLREFFNRQTIKKLAQYIENNPAQSIYTSIAPLEKKEYYPSSPAQQRLYFIHKMEPESTVYNLPQIEIVVLNEEVDMNTLTRAFAELIERHESLRTSFYMEGEEPAQKIHDEVEFKIEYDQTLDNGHWSLENCQGSGEVPSPIRIEEITRNFIRPFDLSRAPLLRIGLEKINESRYLLMLDVHHVISDGVSQEILKKEIVSLYKGEELPTLKIQYKDYTEWWNSKEITEKRRQQKQFWVKEFKDEIPELNMPYDYKRTAGISFEGDQVKFVIEKELFEKLNELSRQTNTTLNMILLAVYNILLSRYAGQDDIVVGSPITGRNHPDLENIIGMFVNMLALRNRPHGDKTLKDFLMEVKEKVLVVMENPYYEFSELIVELGLQTYPRKNPLFNVVFAMQNINLNRKRAYDPVPPHKVNAVPYEFNNMMSPFDLILWAREEKQRIMMSLVYSAALFKSTTVKEMSSNFKEILAQVVENENIKLRDISISHSLVAADPGVVEVEQDEFEF
jgi:acyl carrier protein